MKLALVGKKNIKKNFTLKNKILHYKSENSEFKFRLASLDPELEKDNSVNRSFEFKLIQEIDLMSALQGDGKVIITASFEEKMQTVR